MVTYSFPLNRGFPMMSSAMIQPIDQTSTIQKREPSVYKQWEADELAVL